MTPKTTSPSRLVPFLALAALAVSLIGCPQPAPQPAPPTPVVQPATKPATPPATQPAAPTVKTPPAAPSKDPSLEQLAKTDHIALLEKCLAHCRASYRDYTCTLIKQERLQGTLGKEQHTTVKFRIKPFSVMMRWTKNPGPADRILFVKGKYDNHMLARPSSGLARLLVKTAKRPPDGKDAKKNSLRTIDQFGFENSLLSLLEFYRMGKERGVMKQEFGGYVQVDGRPCMVLVRHLPDNPKYPSGKTTTYLDVEWLVPVGVTGHSDKDGLICRYIHKDVKFNVGLTDKDFDPKANGLVVPK